MAADFPPDSCLEGELLPWLMMVVEITLTLEALQAHREELVVVHWQT